MSNPGDALTTSAAAAAEAGTGGADTTTMACEALVIGMFFDGTNNSRDHVGTGNVNWHTNVDVLHRIYAVDPPERALINGQMRQVTFEKEYLRGIAVRPNGATIAIDGRAGAFGVGDEGVPYRVDEAVEMINQKLPGWMAGKEICNVVFDLFGFSRGAAAARYFANRVKDGDINAGEAEVSVRFIGVFDTVSSIGYNGNPGNHGDVRLNTTGFPNATIFQVIADDEVRYNFPLCEVYGRQIRMVGSHPDIGGGRYPPGESGHLYYAPIQGHAMHDNIVERWGFRTGSGGLRPVNDFGDRLDAFNLQAIAALPRTSDRITFHWSAQHGLQNVSLRLMHDHALAAGIPFQTPLPGMIGPVDTSLDSTLQTYYDSMRENGVCTIPGFEDQVRQQYAKFAGSNDPTTTSMPEVTSVRRSTKL